MGVVVGTGPRPPGEVSPAQRRGQPHVAVGALDPPARLVLPEAEVERAEQKRPTGARLGVAAGEVVLLPRGRGAGPGAELAGEAIEGAHVDAEVPGLAGDPQAAATDVQL